MGYQPVVYAEVVVATSVAPTPEVVVATSVAPTPMSGTTEVVTTVVGQARLAQLAEASDLKSLQSGFESRGGHVQIKRPQSIL